jgi:hypothetical protein
VGYYSAYGNAVGVALSGNYAYVVDEYALRAIDVSTPSSPVEAGSYDTPGYALDVDVRGSYAYVADYKDGVRVIHIADPDTLVEVGYYDTGYSAGDVLVDGDYIYVADVVDGIYILEFDSTTVDVLITNFAAHAVDLGVQLNWEISADEAVEGFKLHRQSVPAGSGIFLPENRLLPPGAESFVDQNVRLGGEYRYTLVVVKADGSEVVSQAVSVKTRSPSFVLYQNSPNPFGLTTRISFALPEESHVTLSIYNLEGKRVRMLVDEMLSEGVKAYEWDGRNDRGNPVSSGIYLYRLKAGKNVLTRKMLLVR